jgi:glycosyltransferase involved in cell wall biosynthesis
VDVVLTNFGRDLRTTGLATRLAGCGIRVVHSFECDEPMKRRWYLPWIFSLIPHAFIFNSRSTQKTVLDSAPRLRSVPSTILSKGIEVPTHLTERPASACLELGFLGQLVERKALPIVLQALAGLSPEKRWRLHVAGSGPARENWESLADRMGLAGRVEFCGFVEDPSAWLESIDVLVHPARREGFGYAPLEALAAGRALLARRGGSVEEILGNCPATAWFEDQNQLRDLLEAWLGPEGLPSAGQREGARRFVATHYSVDRMGDDLDTLLRAELQRR